MRPEGAAHRIAASDVLVVTSRDLVATADPQESLAIARRISHALTQVAADVIHAGPAWVVAKGGITSHDIAVNALGMRRAEVAGQMGHGIISLFRPVSARTEAVGMPYVVFAGNVGSESALADVVQLFRSA